MITSKIWVCFRGSAGRGRSCDPASRGLWTHPRRDHATCLTWVLGGRAHRLMGGGEWMGNGGDDAWRETLRRVRITLFVAALALSVPLAAQAAPGLGLPELHLRSPLQPGRPAPHGIELRRPPISTEEENGETIRAPGLLDALNRLEDAFTDDGLLVWGLAHGLYVGDLSS